MNILFALAIAMAVGMAMTRLIKLIHLPNVTAYQCYETSYIVALSSCLSIEFAPKSPRFLMKFSSFPLIFHKLFEGICVII